MPHTSSDGITLRYEDQGHGEPALLFMPSWCMSRRMFVPLLDRMSPERRGLALDWRGHGTSDPPRGDFGQRQLVTDALAVIAASGAERVIPVAMGHAGWIALELRRLLGPRIPKLVLFDWVVADPSPELFATLRALQDPQTWLPTRVRLFSEWKTEGTPPEVNRFIDEVMGSHGFEMWARAAREIEANLRHDRGPLRALERLDPPVPTFHIYAQPEFSGYLELQERFAAEHPWYIFHKLDWGTQFAIFECPDIISGDLEAFAAAGEGPAGRGARVEAGLNAQD